MHDELVRREQEGQSIGVALVGAGSMGLGIAWQVGRTPGMHLVSVSDLDLEAAVRAARAHGGPHAVVTEGDRAEARGPVLVSRDPSFLVERAEELGIDVLVEATPTIGFAARLCLAALRKRVHVVLMNAEVDLAFGVLLQEAAQEAGVVVTSDAGDQHGVLGRMIRETRMWGFRTAMAGNIKGFLDRYATAESLEHEARIRNLNPVQCCAYTDGTKLAIEMALIGNAEGLRPWVRGMEGPRAADVREVFQLFDFERYGGMGVVDYILGAEPGGGVFVVGHCDDELQASYLKYYKLGDGPFYLFYRPYHLCHLETTRAIATAALYGKAMLSPRHGRLTGVYAHAKREVEGGETVHHAIGGDQFYGLIETCAIAEREGLVPITMLEGEDGYRPRIKRRIARDEPLCRDDVELVDEGKLELFRQQEQVHS